MWLARGQHSPTPRDSTPLPGAQPALNRNGIARFDSRFFEAFLKDAPATQVPLDCRSTAALPNCRRGPSDTDLTQQITAPVTYSISILGKCWRIWWTHLDSNQGPLACEASALTGLSYASTGASDYRAERVGSQVDRKCSAGR